jgi:hypothetical protein
MPKSTTTCNNILALLYNATPWANIADNASASPIATVYMALATASYTAASNASSNETAYTNYVRQSIARTTSGWTAPASGATSNAAAIEYPQCGVTGATITSAATCKTTGAADIFHYGDLNSPIAVSNQIQPRFPIGSVTISES